MSGPTGGRNSKAPTPEHPTPCVASKLCPMRADWIITHRNIQRHGDDPKLYTRSFHTPEHPTPHMESVSHAGTSNAASETSNWGRTRKKDEKPYLNHRVWAAEAAARRRENSGSNQSSSRPEFVVFDGGKRAGLGRGDETSRTGPRSGGLQGPASGVDARDGRVTPRTGSSVARYCPLWAWLHSHQPARFCFWELTKQLPRVVTHPGIAPASNSLNFGVPTNPKPVSSQKASRYEDARVVTHPGIAPASNSLNFGVPTNPKPVSSQKASRYEDARCTI
ncbi:hypothetical protein L3X38_012475 [Prunus dulcis]|uniref:Uncharacterized protein n=1 Tax=Prunus dulcis TaxID=3755 RepID=A0AAD4WJC8_PRUDU|nr:hypothetical protein L3X38_012475 [Prunus dulcis]